MNDTTILAAAPDYAAIKGKQNAAWSSGDYAVVGTTLQIVGESLAEAVAKALQSKGRRPRVALATEGAARTAEIVRERLAIVGG